MEIGAYLCLSGLIFAVGLVLFFSLMGSQAMGSAIRRGLLHYVLYSALVSLAGIILFEGFLIVDTKILIGRPTSLNIPRDLGPLGWVMLLIPIAGLLAPIYFSLREARKTRQ